MTSVLGVTWTSGTSIAGLISMLQKHLLDKLGVDEKEMKNLPIS